MEYIWYGEKPFDREMFENKLSKRNEPFKNEDDVRRQFTVYNKGWLKPKCISSIWGSPNAVSNKNKDYYTWKEWCKDNDFRVGNKPLGSDEEPKNSFKYYQKFNIKSNAKILKIKSWESIINFFKNYTNISKSLLNVLINEYDEYKQKTIYNIDKLRFDFVLTDEFLDLNIDYEKIYNEYDGMEVYHFDFELVHCIFNLWDCDSICIWHKDCIKLLDGGKVNEKHN